MKKNLLLHIGFISLMLFLWEGTPVWSEESFPRRNMTAVVLRDFPPLYQLDEKNNPGGLAIEILDQVADKLGWKIHYQVVENWEDAAAAVRNKEADLMPAMAMAPRWEKEFIFSEPVETIAVSCFVVQSNQQVGGCDQLSGLRVAAIRQGAAFLKLENNSHINLIPAINMETALFQLVKGAVDVFVAPHGVVLNKAASMGLGDAIKPVGKPLLEMPRGMMVRKDNALLKSKMDQALQEIVHTPQYRESYQRWYGLDKKATNQDWYKLGWLFLLPLAGLFWWVGRRLAYLLKSRGSAVPVSPLEYLHNKVTAWIILAISILLTILAWHISNVSVEERAKDRFAFKVEEARIAIYKRMREYEQVLRGGVGLFNASTLVTRQDWHNYVTTLQLDTFWPGIQGMGFSLMFPPEEKLPLVRKIREEGFLNFSVRPPGERPVYSSIIYLEPFKGRNLRAFGFDMFSEEVRRSAMEQARDSGLPALSGRVTLVQETNKDVQFGFLMYLPVYKHGYPTNTVQERRLALSGFVYSPFRIRDLMRGMLGHGIPDLDFAIHDGTEVHESGLLYSSVDKENLATPHRSRYTTTSLMDLPGRTWLVTFSSRASFEKEMESHQSLIVAFMGMTVDLLLFFIVLALSGQKDRVEKRAQSMAAQLNKAESHYRIMVENVKDVIFQTDALGHWTFLNAAWQEISGHGVEDTLGKKWTTFIQSSEHHRALVDFQQLMRGRKETFRDEFMAVHKSGKILWLEVYAALQTGEDGTVQGMAGILRDVSIRKEMEEAMVAARQAAETANRAKSEFLANMSHELRTPLNSLLILSQLLTKAKNLTLDQRDSARVIYDSGMDLLNLINQVLDLSKIEAGRMELLPEVVNLNRFMAELEEQFRPLADSKGLTLTLSMAADLPAAFITDGAKVEQVLRNLLANAIKFTEKGEVALHLFRPQGNCPFPLPRQQVIAFAVTDSGIGIPANQLGQVFETFHQVDGATSRKFGGTGLGLSISRKFAHLLQGEIQVTSQLGVGSTFTLFLPELPLPVGFKQETQTPLVDFRAPWATVLVVDDDARNRFALQTILADLVKEVKSADNGEQALKCLNDFPHIDIVFMDIMMPVMDGFQTIQAIRQNAQWAELPIIALTAKAMSGDRLRCLEVGANGYLSKPVNIEHLLLALRQWLPARQAEEPSPPLPPPVTTPEPELVPLLTLHGQPITLLVVDDDMRAAFTLAKGMQTRVEKIILAADGIRALKELESHPEIDAVLLDMRMPHMDGFATLEKIRGDERFKHLVVIAVTAMAMAGDREKCLAAGADGYLAKPVSLDTLCSHLMETLVKRTVHPQERSQL
ncbi:MAG: response regulator [Magnetococcales bacterium]|nr:CHASE domain-containing protein [Magnetococcales bacterium]NGZ25372.1 response regulator [Magnetococcales bacterium]